MTCNTLARRRTLTILSLLLLLPALLMPSSVRAQSACASTYVVQSGDTLSGIAARFLGALGDYSRIVSATNNAASADRTFPTISNPNTLEVGWKLCLPAGSAAIPAVAPARSAAAIVAAAPTATPMAAQANLSVDDDFVFDPELLTIAWLREQVTPGSDIVIEQTLSPGSNYNRYVASYLSDGLNIDAYMTVPQGTPPATGWPVVVFNHGYIPPDVYRPTERYIAYQDAFARNGYIVFRPDYRGHADSEGEATGAYGSPGYAIDVLNAVSSIKQYPSADPNRIGLWGHSMGGYLTLRAMVAREDIKAGVIWAGVVGTYADMLNNWRRPNSQPPPTVTSSARRWRTAVLEEMGTPEENPAYWASISANSFLRDLSGPVQLHHGTLDTSVPVTFTRTLEDQIVAMGGVVEYYEYPGDDHNLAANLSTALERSVAFFDRYVKNAD